MSGVWGVKRGIHQVTGATRCKRASALDQVLVTLKWSDREVSLTKVGFEVRPSYGIALHGLVKMCNSTGVKLEDSSIERRLFSTLSIFNNLLFSFALSSFTSCIVPSSLVTSCDDLPQGFNYSYQYREDSACQKHTCSPCAVVCHTYSVWHFEDLSLHASSTHYDKQYIFFIRHTLKEREHCCYWQ